MKYTAPSYKMTRVEAEDIITASTGNAGFTVGANGQNNVNNGNPIYDAMLDINDYLANLNK